MLKSYIAAAGKDAGKGLLVDIGLKGLPNSIRWTNDRRQALYLTPGQARKVIAVLRTEGITAATSC